MSVVLNLFELAVHTFWFKKLRKTLSFKKTKTMKMWLFLHTIFAILRFDGKRVCRGTPVEKHCFTYKKEPICEKKLLKQVWKKNCLLTTSFVSRNAFWELSSILVLVLVVVVVLAVNKNCLSSSEEKDHFCFSHFFVALR
jgi:hypothetical protein